MAEWMEDVYLGDANCKINELAILSNENWSSKGKNDNAILKNYLRFTYKKLSEENKIIKTSEYAIFNTGRPWYLGRIFAACIDQSGISDEN